MQIVHRHVPPHSWYVLAVFYAVASIIEGVGLWVKHPIAASALLVDHSGGDESNVEGDDVHDARTGDVPPVSGRAVHRRISDLFARWSAPVVTTIAPSCGFASEFALALFLAAADLADGDVLLILPSIVVEPPPFPCVFLANTSGTAARAER
ncbi:uncharacterized protein AMSG_10598 [Thecamonas trahens ATCC 50062]|uniref:Uncharacterized protein n=1 Tax=Thecamonas trahens ATCC 50062 TaxID=461836 RepID=A0A0L0DTX8_THETB|nr:hypothetical protein AMSG_10598 [Thecamonas trahens ATCC 50062]KNC54933.1 hypothetical protein AMSG_10598 [Thecamonas trahens ATCC 50062]|eukprot:XP_013753520.1 hypothetical protein AMSG_10598 [Thecamonas trahens ATCC 50062]